MLLSTAEVRCVILLSINGVSICLFGYDFVVTYDPVQQIRFEQGMKMVMEMGT